MNLFKGLIFLEGLRVDPRGSDAADFGALRYGSRAVSERSFQSWFAEPTFGWSQSPDEACSVAGCG